MKNIKKLIFDLTYQHVTICYGKKAYREIMEELTGGVDEISKGGVCSRLTSPTGIQYIVGIVKPGKSHHITAIKALLVHELSHLTTMIMEDSNIWNDEFRSHVIQWLYEEIIPWIDELYLNKIGKKEK